MNSMNYVLLIDSVINALLLLYIIYFLERNLRLNWLIKEQINVMSLSIMIVIICFFLSEVSIVIGFIMSVTRGAIHPFLHVFHMIPWIVFMFVLTITLATFAFIVMSHTKMLFIYTGSRIKLIVKRTNKDDAK